MARHPHVKWLQNSHSLLSLKSNYNMKCLFPVRPSPARLDISHFLLTDKDVRFVWTHQNREIFDQKGTPFDEAPPQLSMWGEWLNYGHNYKSFTFGADT